MEEEENRALTCAMKAQFDLRRPVRPVLGSRFHPEPDSLEHGYAVLVRELQAGGRARGKVAAGPIPEAARRECWC